MRFVEPDHEHCSIFISDQHLGKPLELTGKANDQGEPHVDPKDKVDEFGRDVRERDGVKDGTEYGFSVSF